MSAIEHSFWANTFLPNTMATYRAEVAQCVQWLGNHSQHDQPMVLQRESGTLVAKVIDAAAIDLDNLLQYEMILFEGKTTAGAMWKHIFFPTNLRDCFIGDSPVLMPDDGEPEDESNILASNGPGEADGCDSELLTCSECDCEVEYVLGAPDGAEVCQECFDAGRH
ncbi:hypothetical protein [Duganella vulcania]|uniref:Uncharacterized protein n=1 Tax=Duganella vulcania TaxID=2692166 RepID=A0A845GG23_9BURK|nr:hypothetical protein [Duganella vulcania]MYM92460.1 hypothetical protein [Duganella vulcania]